MMRMHPVIGFIALLALLLSNNIWAASPGYPAADTSLVLPGSLNERVRVMTDRHIYAVGERILFAAVNLIPAELDTTCWSKVLYLELLTPGGTSVAQGKFPLSCSGASGYLTIPEDLLTGNYYLTAYTKWMRNFSPMDFHYRPVKIINPYTHQLESSSLSTGKGQTLEREKITLNEAITCKTDKALYHQREKVNLSINIPASAGSFNNTYHVTVVRDGASATLGQLEIKPADIQYHRPPGTIYLPETMGLSLSGRLVSTDPAVPVRGADMVLSILGREPEFRVARSGPGGSFCFALDSMTGRHDMYIASDHDDRNLQILIDNDFANPAVKFPEIPFELSETEKELAREIIFNMQINRHFHTPDEALSTPAGDREDRQIIAFYGLPSSSIWIDDYIELPTFKEVLIELVPGVFPRERNKKPYLTFTGNKLTFSLINQYTPLLLVDQVPVFDLEQLLVMSPKKILRVEVLNEIYIIGNNTYGGILNIITRKSDLGGIDLPENSFFFDFTSFLPQDELCFPEYADQAFDSENPDYRNCLSWAPHVRVAPGQETMLDFYTSDNSGEYRVLIRGVAPDGSILQGSCEFRVE
jgi:hypothetical protein